MFIESGMHAREWIGVATSTYILNQLLTSTDASIRAIAENYNWYIFPVANPDGYSYTHTTVSFVTICDARVPFYLVPIEVIDT